MWKRGKRRRIFCGAFVLGFACMLAIACSTVQPGQAGAPRQSEGGEAEATPIQTSDVNAFCPALDNMSTVTFTEDDTAFANPERGWYRAYYTDDMWDVDKLRQQGITVILLEANLKDFTQEPISEAKLQEIRNSFDKARQYGLEVMFRAAYDFDGVSGCEPNDLSTILGHIAQLKDIFTRNEDILYCVQAGFLGPWGEWHSSRFGDPPSLEARKAVLSALMDAVPESRDILVRRPMFIRDMFQDWPGGSALTQDSAFSQSYLARTGYHDDALLSTEEDSGTYDDPAYSREDELNWTDNQDRYVPFVAESCQLTSYSDPDNAVYELNKLHAQALDATFYPGVIDKWKSTAYGGMSTYDYISQRLGYRFILKEASLNSDVRKGGALHLRFSLVNDGFGNLINDRPLEVVLSNGVDTYTAEVSDDPRRWDRESGTVNRDLYFSIPSDISSGQWSLYLSLPSAFPSLNKNPLYSVRFADQGVWQSDTGYNLVMSGIDIENPLGSNTGNQFRQISREQAESFYSLGENK